MLVWWATCLIWDTPVVLHPEATSQHPLLLTEAHPKRLQKTADALEGIKAILKKTPYIEQNCPTDYQLDYSKPGSTLEGGPRKGKD